MIYRIIGALLLSFCGAYGAHLLNTGARRTLCGVEALLEFMRFLRSQIDCFALPLGEILARCPTEILESCGCTGERPRTLGELLSQCDVEDLGARAAFERFCKEVGKGYRDEQLALCDYCIGEIEARRSVLSGVLPSRKKVNSALCVAGALALVIILF